MVAAPAPLRSVWLGRAEYRGVLELQHAERERVWAGGAGTIFLCEHPPVITLGRSATLDNVLAPGDVPIERIERGGDVTYHGPGQLMVYPVVRVRGVVDFLSRVAGALADACAALGVVGAEFRRDPAGVWLGPAKLAACGIHIARGVSVHGYALNVCTPSNAWTRIRPCGLSCAQVSLADALAARELPPVSVEQVAVEAGPRLVAALL
ncbi:MAG TPA: lipoyl(octanoyl) transferase LipB [Kofleriaceae bacterium]